MVTKRVKLNNPGGVHVGGYTDFYRFTSVRFLNFTRTPVALMSISEWRNSFIYISHLCYVQILKESGHSQGTEERSGSGSSGSYRLPIVTGSWFWIQVTKGETQGTESRQAPVDLIGRHRDKEREEK